MPELANQGIHRLKFKQIAKNSLIMQQDCKSTQDSTGQPVVRVRIEGNSPEIRHEFLSNLFGLLKSRLSCSLICLILSLYTLQYVTPCLGYGFFNYPNNISPFDYNSFPWSSPSQYTINNHYQPQPPQTQYNYNNNRNHKRFIYDGNSDIMVPLDSLTSDQQNQMQSSIGQPNAQNGWTSSLINTFLGGSTPTNQPSDSLDKHIRKILVPRVSGTQGNIQVRQYIVDSLKANNYHVDLDEFIDSTPIGDVGFANIIATSNPTACRQLVLACHYDSKMMDGFLGAIDSAVPCAMLLKISETFSKSFRQLADASPENDVGLRFIFFDGEEAFVQWTSRDSLYGSRHLAAKWQKQSAPSQCPSNRFKNELSRIELFVLLDLIGASDSSFVMYNRGVKNHYNNMQKYERQHLTTNGMSAIQMRREVAFKNRYIPLDTVEDDHVPFKRRGVPILSLLSNPFPRVWHTTEDNYNAIDFPRTRRILHVLEEFVSNYSKLED